MSTSDDCDRNSTNAVPALKPWSVWAIVLPDVSEGIDILMQTPAPTSDHPNRSSMELAIARISEPASSAQEILQRILDTTRECVLVVDADMRISHCNVPAAVAFGRD